MSDDVPKLDGCQVLPPLEAYRHEPDAKPDAKPTSHKQSAGRFATLNAFVDVSLAELCRGDIAVWLILYRDTRNGTARTAQADIARRSGLSVRGVGKALKRLEKRRLLKLVYRGGLNRGASRYRVEPLATPQNPTPKKRDHRGTH